MLLTNTGESYEPQDTDIIAWQRAYPAVNVHQELNAMESWLDANPTRRKTMRGMKKFINAWLSRAQDKGGSPMVRSKSDSSRAISIEDKLADVSWVTNEDTKSQAIAFFNNKYGFHYNNGERHNG
tara:strand:- start:10673 stop:11047 length:375 start_codon:yes stop_codon:yes gene_type:complete